MLSGYGHVAGEERDHPRTLREVTLAGSPAALRAVARLLEASAARLEAGRPFGHEHLRDAWPEWRTGQLDVIVTGPPAGEKPAT